MSTITPNLTFFGNHCNAIDKLQVIRAFHSEIESLISEKNSSLQKIEVEFDQDRKLYEQKFHFEHTLKPNLRDAVIVGLTTFLEIELQNFCKDLQLALSLKVKHDDLKGSILDQFRIYTQLAELNIDFGSSCWQSVREVVELRNCIVHYSGWIEDWYGRKFNRANSIENLSKKFNSIQIDERGLISLNEQACEECIAIIDSFITAIYDSALQKFPKGKDESYDGPF